MLKYFKVPRIFTNAFICGSFSFAIRQFFKPSLRVVLIYFCQSESRNILTVEAAKVVFEAHVSAT